MLQLNISKIARMLRELYSLGTESEQETIIQQLVVENQGLRDMLNKDMSVFNLGNENDTLRERSSDTLIAPK